MQRRTFIAAAGASVLPLLGGGLALGTGKAMAAIPQAKLNRISIAGSVFKAHFDNWEYAFHTDIIKKVKPDIVLYVTFEAHLNNLLR